MIFNGWFFVKLSFEQTGKPVVFQDEHMDELFYLAI